jgi:hypothetical protein
MSNAEDISSTILSNVDIIAYIYSIIKDAGLRTVEDDDVKAVKSNTTIIKANLSNVNRVTKNCRFPKTNDKECRTSKQYSIDYNAADIMIVGGAALNLYDYLLTSFKGRHSMTALEDYIKKKTSDIDIVWWPRSVTNISTGHLVDNEIVTSSSPAITKLVYVLRNEIATGLEAKKAELQAKLKEYVPGSKNTDVLTIEVGGDRYDVDKPAHTWKAGSWTIAIKFTYGDKVFKICEVLVHDSGASQLFDENGNIITDLRYMAKDPVYCSPNQSMPNHISWLNINGTDIGVPNVLSFVKQQMLAFSNNMTRNRDEAGNWNFKGFINYKRVEFIKMLLENIKLNDNSNISDLTEVFKTTNTEYPARIVSQINQIENMNIERLNNKIIQLCEHFNSTKDPIISELCDKANSADLKEWIKMKKEKLTQLKTILHNQYKKGPTSEFRRAYSDLERNTDQIIFRLGEIPLKELKNHNYYKGEDPVLLIERAKAEIDRKQAKHKKNKSTSQNVRVDNSVVAEAASQGVIAALGAPKRSLLGDVPTLLTKKPEAMAISATSGPAVMKPLTMSMPSVRAPPLPPEFGSVFITTSPSGNIFKSSEGIYWYIDPKTYRLLRRNPWSGRYEFPGQRHPSDGLGIQISPQGIKFIVDEYYRRVLRLNPFTREWEEIQYGVPLNIGLPPPAVTYLPPPPPPPPSMGRKGRGGFHITFKNRQSFNNTKKNK